MRMKSIADIGLKITARTREYYRYTDVSADLERRGAGSSRHQLAWAVRSTPPREKVSADIGPVDPINRAKHS
jgi:hypothetical protein